MLDLSGTGKDADAVAVTVKVTDPIWCAVIALALGFAAATLFQLCFRRRRPARLLREAADNLKSEYGKAKEEFDKRVPKQLKAFSQPSSEADKYARDLNRGLTRYRNTTVYLDTDSETWKNLRKSLDIARADIAFWKESDGFAKALLALREELTELRDFLLVRRFHDQTPALAETAAKLLKPEGEMKVGEAIERAKQADALIPVLKSWQELAKLLLRYQVWWHGVRAKTGEITDEEDKKTFFSAGAKLVEAKRELMQAKDAQALEHLTTEEDLALAHDELAYLGLRYHVPMPESDELVDVVVAAADDEPPDVALLSLFPAQGLIDTVEDMIQKSGRWLVDAARALRVYDVGGRFVDWAWIALTVVAGGIPPLSTFYIDKEWGTGLDYLTVVVVGVAAQTLLKTVVDAFDQILSSRASVLEAEPEPAKSAAAQ